MLIAQLSDTHVCCEGQLYMGVSDSNRRLRLAIEHLHALDCRPDLVLITGDLVADGLAEEYAVAVALLAELEMPYLVIPGNHDNREVFRTAFASHSHLPRQGPLHYSIDNHAMRIIGLDTSVPGLHHGELDSLGLKWLERTLSERIQTPTLLMMHHPPFVSGIPYLDEYRYFREDELGALLRSFSNVEGILCGHVHRMMVRRWAGTIVIACPSTATEIALQLRPDSQPRSYLGPPACMLHLWSPQSGLLSHTSHIGDFPGPYAFA